MQGVRVMLRGKVSLRMGRHVEGCLVLRVIPLGTHRPIDAHSHLEKFN